jgi:type II restriction/modification system DNA methylase subunit YeeA
MNKAKLKSYAPQARRDFIAAVTARANLLGLSEKDGELNVAASQTQGDTTVIAGQAWPVKVNSQRNQLIARMKKDGFSQTVEAVAYTWFNRFAALRYMEVHDYLSHSYRALSSRDGLLPDILIHAAEIARDSTLPGLKTALVAEMKLSGNRDGELYRMLLVAQCNALSATMPFLFERIDDETELLLPDNLLRTDSVIAKLVAAIDEDDWSEVEIIGWLYQFYISERKGEVIGKMVKSEDIPAATQLFTPNWIVQYLVQNSIGRLWLLANPNSTLAAHWPYYVAPADQTAEIQAQLDALIQTRMNDEGGSLNPQSITLLDPACGSGHILVEAYEVLKAIYLERGFQPRAIPRLILENNLYGLDIDDRAAQMAGFALVMKARADDRRLFIEPIKPNVWALQESKLLDADGLSRALQSVANSVHPKVVANASANDFGKDKNNLGAGLQFGMGESGAEHVIDAQIQPLIASLISIFADAKTFGSLIQIPQMLNGRLEALAEHLQLALQDGDLYARSAARDLLPLVEQARVLGMQFDAVVANPPYMGGKGMNPALRDYAKAAFPDSKSDSFAMFIERGFGWCKPSGFNSMVTMQSWMFLSSYQAMRERILKERTIQSMAHLGARAFSEISGEIVQTTAFVMQGSHFRGFKPVFLRLVEGQEEQKAEGLRTGKNRFDMAVQDDFHKIPGSPLAYWVSEKIKNLFAENVSIGQVASPRKGNTTTNNAKFLRFWPEVSFDKAIFDSENSSPLFSAAKKWVPYNKGGGYRKWYGFNEFLINWQNGGAEIKKIPHSVVANEQFFFQPGLTWSTVTSGKFSIRKFDKGYVFDNGGCCIFGPAETLTQLLGFMNSKVFESLYSQINPTLNFQSGDVARVPFLKPEKSFEVDTVVSELVAMYTRDYQKSECSWGFESLALLGHVERGDSIETTWLKYKKEIDDQVKSARALEEKNNRIFIDAYGLQDEISAQVSEDEIAFARADREKDSQRLISYAVGCMMGRYSLDGLGLIYARGGNVGFDSSRYVRFPADTDGIVPVSNEIWFEDEAASRIREFLCAVWGADTLAVNTMWLAEGLGIKQGETPDEAIRRYLAEKFYKDHLQTYKKRPIYWLFSSGKQGAFQALVYLHRYHVGTLARIRAEYVVPLIGRIYSRVDMLEKDAAAATSIAVRNKLAKEVEKLKKKHVELLAYDEQLRHYADMRIALELDDGVKENYNKFGNLLAEVKAVTGGAIDD